MSHATITDYVLWTKHVHGPDAARLAVLGAGETVELRIDGEQGTWRKMEDGSDGRPTPGLRPLGAAQTLWRSLYKARRGDLVELEVIKLGGAGAPETARSFEDKAVAAARDLVKTDASRKAALEAFLGLAGQGWRSEGPYSSREELHQR